MTPNLLARTIETVEGGGLVVLLLHSLSSLTSLYTMVMVGFRIPDVTFYLLIDQYATQDREETQFHSLPWMADLGYNRLLSLNNKLILLSISCTNTLFNY